MGSFTSKQQYDMAEIQKLVDELIANNKTYCPYCTATKSLLKKLGENAEVIELDKRDDGDAIQDFLQQKSGQRTVPNVYINGKHIGGNSDLQALNSSGQLQKLLTA
ncbi:unnamed protein product [Cunninghamella blakesleeana]